MEEITNAFLYEVLKNIQASQAEIRATLADHTRELIRIRDDINLLRTDGLRRASVQAQMNSRLQRIETRLDLSET